MCRQLKKPIHEWLYRRHQVFSRTLALWNKLASKRVSQRHPIIGCMQCDQCCIIVSRISNTDKFRLDSSLCALTVIFFFNSKDAFCFFGCYLHDLWQEVGPSCCTKCQSTLGNYPPPTHSIVHYRKYTKQRTISWQKQHLFINRPNTSTNKTKRPR